MPSTLTSFPRIAVPRRRHLIVRVSDDEHAQLAADAEQAERTVSDVARLRLFGRAPAPPHAPLRPHPGIFGQPSGLVVTRSDELHDAA